jgi:hypothetical protein
MYFTQNMEDCLSSSLYNTELDFFYPSNLYFWTNFQFLLGIYILGGSIITEHTDAIMQGWTIYQ